MDSKWQKGIFWVTEIFYTLRETTKFVHCIVCKIISKFLKSSQTASFDLVLKEIWSLTGQSYLSYYLWGELLKPQNQKVYI